MMYEERFQDVHQLLKDYGCKSTYSFHKEYEPHPVFGGSFFYRPEQDMNNDHIQKEWREKVDARLDVCVTTKKSFSEKQQIRFDIEWSQQAHLYSMYISLPTSARSISLRHERYKTQEELIIEINKWLLKAGCVRNCTKIIPRNKMETVSQMSLF